MDIERCFEILELDRGASSDEIKQAYKDIVNVWHPDRFSSNPRLKQKAEEKLKEINVAYDTLKAYLSTEQRREPKQERAETNVASRTVEKTKDKAQYQKTQPDTEAYDKTEAVVEAGTGIVLGLWSYLSSLFQRVVTDVKTEIGQGELNQRQRGPGSRGRNKRRDTGRGKGMGGGMGRGKGLGKGGGGRGRGK